MSAIRARFWRWLRRGVPSGELLPSRLIIARALLFPLDFLFWKLSRSRGYQIETDTWLIYGVRYSAELFRTIATPSAKMWRIVARDGDVVTVEEVILRDSGKHPAPPREPA